MGNYQMYLTGAAVALVVVIVYMLDPSFGGLLRGGMRTIPPRGIEAFTDLQAAPSGEPVGVMESDGDAADHFSSVAKFDETINPTGDSGNQTPNGCYPRKQLDPSELLPKDPNTLWNQVNPQGQGDLAGKSQVAAGYHLGVQTVGSSNRIPNLQLRADPPCPQVAVSPWGQSTVQPDTTRRGVEIN